MPEPIIHIGRNKTGSTALQWALSRNRKTLEQHGFVYPDIGGKAQHAFLAMHLNHRLRPTLAAEIQAENEQLAGALRQTLMGDKTPIISSEGLQNIRPEHLAEWLGGTNARIVVYIREQAEYLLSFYQQAVKAGKTDASFADFTASYDVDFKPFLDRWAQVFGQDRLSVRVYDRARLIDGDVVADFCAAIGLSPLPHHPDALERLPKFGKALVNRCASLGILPRRFAAIRDPNPSIGGALLEATRRFNHDGRTMSGDEYATLCDLARTGRYARRPAVSADVIAEIRARYADANTELSDRYFGGKPVFDLRPIDTPVVSPAEVEAAAMALQKALVAAQRRRRRLRGFSLLRRERGYSPWTG